VLGAAAAAGKAAVDPVHLDIADLDGLAAEVEDAAASGFAATACIHPSQVAVIRAGYAPTPDEVAWAERVLAAAESNPGVFRFEGRMVDGPVLMQARTVLARR
jgi:citrate lyase subunit beta/citryl-CoA lyase